MSRRSNTSWKGERRGAVCSLRMWARDLWCPRRQPGPPRPLLASSSRSKATALSCAAASHSCAFQGEPGLVAASLDKGKQSPRCPQGHPEHCPPRVLLIRTWSPRDMTVRAPRHPGTIIAGTETKFTRPTPFPLGRAPCPHVLSHFNGRGDPCPQVTRGTHPRP